MFPIGNTKYLIPIKLARYVNKLAEADGRNPKRRNLKKGVTPFIEVTPF